MGVKKKVGTLFYRILSTLLDIGQLRVGKGYLMVTVGQQGYLKENLTQLHIIVRTTGSNPIFFL